MWWKEQKLWNQMNSNPAVPQNNLLKLLWSLILHLWNGDTVTCLKEFSRGVNDIFAKYMLQCMTQVGNQQKLESSYHSRSA